MTALIVGIFIGIIGATIYYDRKLLQELKSYRKHFQSHSKCDDCIAADIGKIVGEDIKNTTYPTESEGER